jgi:hypothetical protein
MSLSVIAKLRKAGLDKKVELLTRKEVIEKKLNKENLSDLEKKQNSVIIKHEEAISTIFQGITVDSYNCEEINNLIDKLTIEIEKTILPNYASIENKIKENNIKKQEELNKVFLKIKAKKTNSLKAIIRNILKTRNALLEIEDNENKRNVINKEFEQEVLKIQKQYLNILDEKKQYLNTTIQGEQTDVTYTNKRDKIKKTKNDLLKYSFLYPTLYRVLDDKSKTNKQSFTQAHLFSYDKFKVTGIGKATSKFVKEYKGKTFGITTFFDNVKEGKVIKNKELKFNSYDKKSKSNPEMLVTLVNNPKVRSSIQNELQLQVFLNLISTIEFSRCSAYMNCTINIPNLIEEEEEQIRKSTSLRTFLTGVKVEGDINTVGMEAFTAPQTLVNLNQKSINISSVDQPRDLTRPFMTIKSFNLDSISNGGLLSYKSGQLQIILHDRTRFKEIAPFVKPELLGQRSSEVVLEYGWSHPDGYNNIDNPIGEFLNDTRCKEVYKILNSSFNMDPSGSVEITLDIAMYTSRDFNQQFISIVKTSEQTIKESELLENKQDLLKILVDNQSNFDRVDSNLSIVETDFYAIADIGDAIKKLCKALGLKSRKTAIEKPDLTTTEIKSLTATLEKERLDLRSGETMKKQKNIIKFLSYVFDIDAVKSAERLSPVLERLLSEKVVDLVSAVYYNLFSLRKSIEKNKQQKKPEYSLRNKLPNYDEFDPYYDFDLAAKINKAYNLSGIHKLPENTTEKELNNSSKEYFTVGSLITAVCANYMPLKQEYTDIQFFVHVCNENAGLMSGKNIFSILMSETQYNQIIDDFFKKNTKVSLGVFIGAILDSAKNFEKNISYGLLDKNLGKNNQKINFDEKLTKIYKEILYRDVKKDSTLIFKPPVIQFKIETLKSENNETIARVNLYDMNDNINESIYEVFKNITLNPLSRQITNYNLNRNDKDKKDSIKLSKQLYEEHIRKYVIFDNKTNKYSFKPDTSLYDIKNTLKQQLPSITYSTEYTTVLNAGLTSMTDPALVTINMTRDNKVALKNQAVKNTLPYKIVPTQVNIDLLGCPWVNFNQDIFVDFSTDTIADNVYKVVGIKHSFEPGSFKTSLTTVPSDQYAKYEVTVKGINKILNSVKDNFTEDSKEEIDKSSISIKDLEKNRSMSDLLKIKKEDNSSKNTLTFNGEFIKHTTSVKIAKESIKTDFFRINSNLIDEGKVNVMMHYVYKNLPLALQELLFNKNFTVSIEFYYYKIKESNSKLEKEKRYLKVSNDVPKNYEIEIIFDYYSHFFKDEEVKRIKLNLPKKKKSLNEQEEKVYKSYFILKRLFNERLIYNGKQEEYLRYLQKQKEVTNNISTYSAKEEINKILSRSNEAQLKAAQLKSSLKYSNIDDDAAFKEAEARGEALSNILFVSDLGLNYDPEKLEKKYNEVMPEKKDKEKYIKAIREKEGNNFTIPPDQRQLTDFSIKYKSQANQSSDFKSRQQASKQQVNKQKSSKSTYSRQQEIKQETVKEVTVTRVVKEDNRIFAGLLLDSNNCYTLKNFDFAKQIYFDKSLSNKNNILVEKDYFIDRLKEILVINDLDDLKNEKINVAVSQSFPDDEDSFAIEYEFKEVDKKSIYNNLNLLNYYINEESKKSILFNSLKGVDKAKSVVIRSNIKNINNNKIQVNRLFNLIESKDFWSDFASILPLSGEYEGENEWTNFYYFINAWIENFKDNSNISFNKRLAYYLSIISLNNLSINKLNYKTISKASKKIQGTDAYSDLTIIPNSKLLKIHPNITRLVFDDNINNELNYFSDEFLNLISDSLSLFKEKFYKETESEVNYLNFNLYYPNIFIDIFVPSVEEINVINSLEHMNSGDFKAYYIYKIKFNLLSKSNKHIKINLIKFIKKNISDINKFNYELNGYFKYMRKTQTSEFSATAYNSGSNEFYKLLILCIDSILEVFREDRLFFLHLSLPATDSLEDFDTENCLYIKKWGRRVKP